MKGGWDALSGNGVQLETGVWVPPVSYQATEIEDIQAETEEWGRLRHAGATEGRRLCSRAVRFVCASDREGLGILHLVVSIDAALWDRTAERPARAMGHVGRGPVPPCKGKPSLSSQHSSSKHYGLLLTVVVFTSSLVWLRALLDPAPIAASFWDLAVWRGCSE